MSLWCNDLWPEHSKEQFFSHHDSANWFHTRCWIYPSNQPFFPARSQLGSVDHLSEVSFDGGRRKNCLPVWGWGHDFFFYRLYHWDSFLIPLSIIHQSWIHNLSNLMTSLIRILIILRSGLLFFCQELSSCGSRRLCVCLGAQMMNRPVSKAN